MGGLLYKDFVNICRIKKVNLIWILAVITFLFVLLRMAFPGCAGGETRWGVSAAGEEMNVIDMVFVSFFALFLLAGLSFINSCTVKIIDGDDKNKIREYLSVMPLSRNAYVASKYLFIGIACYVFLSLASVWGIVCLAYCEPGGVYDLCQILMSFVITFLSFTLFLAAIELPLFILYGKEKAVYSKVAFLLMLSFVVIGYILFGNLNWISETLDVDHLIHWVNRHQAGITIFQSLSPVITIGIYYLSYKITCMLTARRER